MTALVNLVSACGIWVRCATGAVLVAARTFRRNIPTRNCVRWVRGALLVTTLSFVALCSAVSAQNTNDSEIPPLRPPIDEIPPGVWEEHSSAIVVGAVLFAATAAMAVLIAMRPAQVAQIVPAVEARSAVQRLKSQPDTGLMLSELSRVLRRYFKSVFPLPQQELTTSEFCEAIRRKSEIGPELAESTASFLKQCDERKFSPRPPHTELDATSEALRLIELGEARVAQAGPNPMVADSSKPHGRA